MTKTNKATGKKTSKENSKEKKVNIKKLNLGMTKFRIRGISPYLQNKWTESAKQEMRSKMQEGTKSAGKVTARPARKFNGEYLEAMHVSTEGWAGIPTAAFRSALIRACKLAGFAMTDAKMAIDIIPDGYDASGHGLVRIEGEAENSEMMVKNSNGSPDIRCRPLFKDWGVELGVSHDADIFSANDIGNLINRAGYQVGIGAGRPASEKSVGLGYGKFRIADMEAAQ